MPPLVRKAPLSERIRGLLNPYDFLLYLSEELHESAIDEKLRDWTMPIGAAANIIYMIARANSANTTSSHRKDDIFGDFDGRGTSGWFAWFATFTAHFLALLSIANAAYTFTRTRKYRLFESPIDVVPTTPSARRVKVEDSPSSSSPLSYFSSKFGPASAAARAHPDNREDVWELSIWDPKPLHLSLFALFSPGHVLVYWLFLPTSALDPRPSVTVVTTMLLAALTTAQLLLFKTFFEQKARDDKLLNKEVLNEYDTKFVHPSLNRPIRDVGTQSKESALSPGVKSREVEVGTPTTVVNRGFRVNPNPSYVGHLGKNINTEDLYAETPPGGRRVGRMSTSLLSPTPATGKSAALAAAAAAPVGYASSGTTMFAPQPQPQLSNFSNHESDFYGARATSPQKPIVRQKSLGSLSQQNPTVPSRERERDRSSGYRETQRESVAGGGGSLGVYTHAASPLRKSSGGAGLLRHQKSAGNLGSPLKSVSLPGAPNFRSAAGSRTSTGGGGLDYLGRPIRDAGDRTVRGDRTERVASRSGSGSGSGDDGLRQRFGGLRDAGPAADNRRDAGRRVSRPY